MLIDTHTHLNEPRFVEDFLQARVRAREAGVSSLIIVGYDLPSSEAAFQMAVEMGEVAAVGVHPHDANQYSEEASRLLLEFSVSPSVVAIGETGLDYHYNNSPTDLQQSVFRSHIRHAKESGLPLIMHCREAYEDLIRILEEEEAGEIGGVAHCFFGTDADAEKLIDLGFYLGVGGGVTFPKSEELRQTLLRVSLDRILLETDCPYMAPVPHRGKRNEPAYLPLVVNRLADLFGRTVEEIEATTTTNALRCFPRMNALPTVSQPG